jgi:hypothetical protein
MAFKIERRASWMLMYVCVCEKAYQFRDMNDHACCTLCICTFLIIFFFIIYWSIISSPSKLIISPYQNLWLKVFELCCITFLRMRSSTEIPRKILVNQFCVTDVSHSSPHVFFLHLFLKSSSLPNDIWVEWIVSLGWDIAWYDNLSHVL